MIQHACAAAGFAPDVAATCADYRSILALVGAGTGVSLIPELALTGWARLPSPCCRPGPASPAASTRSSPAAPSRPPPPAPSSTRCRTTRRTSDGPPARREDRG
ncbi:LysR substrate-binding domain-containing protein [Actinomadura sp.]|uniref:LysR substrate-binding domain-containing protein n=1 Tax=Actinomadura sp. TaxID=1989 RepID=UPI0037CA303C